MLGQRFCGPCRDYRIRQMQGYTPQTVAAPLAGTGAIRFSEWLSEGWLLIKDDWLTFAVATLIFMLLGAVGSIFVTIPLQCGMAMMVYRKMTFGTVQIGDVFDGFRRAGWAILTGLLLTVAAGVVLSVEWMIGMALLLLAASAQSTGISVLAMLLWAAMILATSLFAGGALFFVVPHIAARNANPFEAISASWQVFRRNPLGISLTAFVYSLLAGLGVVACFLGLFVTVPWIAAAHAKAYADHFGISGFDDVYTPGAGYLAPPPQ
jgi:hypothetical protein